MQKKLEEVLVQLVNENLTIFPQKSKAT